jgi:cyclophilin family peptidyl-prolyl cis-trans isomerase
MRLTGPRAVGRTPAPAASALSEEDRGRVATHLLAMTREQDAGTRIHAVRGLGSLAGDSTTTRLLSLRADPDWRVRVEVARALAATDRSLRAKDLRPLLEDRNPNVRVAAVEALAAVGPDAEAIAKLRSLLGNQRPRIRQVAFLAYLERLRRQGDPLPGPAVDAIERAALDLLAQRDWSLRALAADGAVLLPIDLSLPILVRMVNDEPRVARAAVDPLLQRRARMRNEPILAQVGSDVQTLLSAPDPVLRATALESLGSILADTTLRPDPSDWLSLESTLEQSRRYAVTADRVPDVRLAAVGVAERFPARPEMVRFLVDSCQDPEYLVRHAAVATLRAVGRTPPRAAEPVETDRSDFEYAAILAWAQEDHWARIETAEGTITVRLLSREAPLTCWNFAELAAQGFFDRSRWHRVVPDFVLQAGCSRGDGYGGSERAIRCEITSQPFAAGVLGMALSGKDTGTSQFFLTHSEQPHLDGRYTAFGVIERGREVADRVDQGANLWSIRVTSERP